MNNGSVRRPTARAGVPEQGATRQSTTGEVRTRGVASAWTQGRCSTRRGEVGDNGRGACWADDASVAGCGGCGQVVGVNGEHVQQKNIRRPLRRWRGACGPRRGRAIQRGGGAARGHFQRAVPLFLRRRRPPTSVLAHTLNAAVRRLPVTRPRPRLLRTNDRPASARPPRLLGHAGALKRGVFRRGERARPTPCQPILRFPTSPAGAQRQAVWGACHLLLGALPVGVRRGVDGGPAVASLCVCEITSRAADRQHGRSGALHASLWVRTRRAAPGHHPPLQVVCGGGGGQRPAHQPARASIQTTESEVGTDAVEGLSSTSGCRGVCFDWTFSHWFR